MCVCQLLAMLTVHDAPEGGIAFVHILGEQGRFRLRALPPPAPLVLQPVHLCVEGLCWEDLHSWEQ